MADNEYEVKKWKPNAYYQSEKSWIYTQKKRTVGELETEIITKEEAKKGIVSERLAQRDKVATAMVNPYLRDTNYLDDIKTQDQFLRPKISSFENKK
tara:strand:- start:104 stop:394 length:291 start_codon:yes stop_codon:yes gene_type:complete